MTCRQFQNEVDEWAGLGEFKLSSKTELHLKACSSCMKEFDALQDLQQILRKDIHEEPAEVFWQKQRASIMENISKKAHFNCFPSKAFVFSFFMLALLVGFLTYSSKWKNTNINSETSLASLYEDDEESLEEIVEDLDLEEVQKAIQNFEDENKRRML